MPSFHEVDARGWAQMYASTDVLSYEIMDVLAKGPMSSDAIPAHYVKGIDQLLKAEWIERLDDGSLTLSDAGRRHLASF